MRAAWMVGWSELRRHRLSVIGLGVVVAVVVAVVLGFAAGARRTASAIDRFSEATEAPDLMAYAPGLTHYRAYDSVEERMRALPGVVGSASNRTFLAEAGTEVDFMISASPDGSAYEQLERPVMLGGRMPSADSIDEVTINEIAAEALDLEVGDRFTLGTYTRDTWFKVMNSDLSEDPLADGPELALTVVGIGRTSRDLSGRTSESNPGAIASPAFYERYGDDLAVVVGMTLLRTDGTVSSRDVEDALHEPWGPAALPDAATQAEPTDGLDSFASIGSVESLEESTFAQVRSANRVIATVLAVIAAVAALAGLLVIGQAVTRQVSLSADVAGTTDELGVTRRGRAAMIAGPSMISVVVGVVVGAVASVGLSPLFPPSVAALSEPDSGLRIDGWVLTAGVVALTLVSLAWVAFSARRAVHRQAHPIRRARSGGVLGRLGGTAPFSIGIRMAYDRDGSRRSIPVRSAVFGALVGTAGVVAVAVFTHTVTTTIDHPDRYGWAFSSVPEVWATGTEAEQMFAPISDEPGIAAVGELRCAPIQLEELTRFACGLEQRKSSMTLSIVEGRHPTGPAEIALGRSVMDELDVGVDDVVTATGTDGNLRELTVVGQAAVPMVDVRSPGDGALVTYDTLEQLTPKTDTGETGRYLVLRYTDEADVAALESRLGERYGLGFNIESRPEAPGQLTQMNRMRGLLVGLGVFLGGLGVVGLVHYLAVSVRRRRPEFGVLRALGFGRAQIRRTVSWQAFAATAVGVVVGVPVGIAIGRMAWSASVASLGLIDPPETPWLVAFLVVVVATGGAALLGLVPGWFAARRSPADALRAE